MVQKKLSQKDIEWLVHKREADDKSLTWIANQLGVTVATVNYYCQKHNVLSSKGLRPRMKSPSARGKSTSDSERDDFIELAKEGLTAYQIGKLMSRPPSTVRYWLGRIALEEEQAERQQEVALRDPAGMNLGNMHQAALC